MLMPNTSTPPHPGRYLSAVLNALQMSARQFAAHVGVAPTTITRLLHEEMAVSPEMAVRLEMALSGTDAKTWLRLQACYDIWQIEHHQNLFNIKKLKPNIDLHLNDDIHTFTQNLAEHHG